MLGILRGYLGDSHPRTIDAINYLAEYFQSVGEFERTKNLQQEVFHTCFRELGVEHQNTTIAAWNLFGTLFFDRSDAERAGQIAETSILWVLSRQGDALGTEQRKIRRALSEIINAAGAT